MRTVRFSVLFLVCAWLVLINGCSSELKDCKLQNRAQQKLIDRCKADLQATEMKLDKCNRQLDYAKSTGNVEVKTLQERIANLEQDLDKKRGLIARMQEQLIGGGVLPAELSTMLEDFAKGEEIVTYDASRGVVKFKSDLLFKSGSDEVLAPAAGAIGSLCAILNSEQGKNFDIIIAGHTDDQPIRYSRPKHPTNWHLSSHRAISVLNIMAKSSIASERMSARGFGEYRPVVPNKPDKKGHPQNRRVEIYIVPKGV